MNRVWRSGTCVLVHFLLVNIKFVAFEFQFVHRFRSGVQELFHQAMSAAKTMCTEGTWSSLRRRVEEVLV